MFLLKRYDAKKGEEELFHNACECGNKFAAFVEY